MLDAHLCYACVRGRARAVHVLRERAAVVGTPAAALTINTMKAIYDHEQDENDLDVDDDVNIIVVDTRGHTRTTKAA